MKKLVDMTSKRLAEILTQHGIHNRDWPAIKALVFYGKRTTDKLRYRLRHVGNYKRCRKAIMTELSESYFKEMGITFPPPDYKAPCSYASLCCKAS